MPDNLRLAKGLISTTQLSGTMARSIGTVPAVCAGRRQIKTDKDLFLPQEQIWQRYSALSRWCMLMGLTVALTSNVTRSKKRRQTSPKLGFPAAAQMPGLSHHTEKSFARKHDVQEFRTAFVSSSKAHVHLTATSVTSLLGFYAPGKCLLINWNNKTNKTCHSVWTKVMVLF